MCALAVSPQSEPGMTRGSLCPVPSAWVPGGPWSHGVLGRPTDAVYTRQSVRKHGLFPVTSLTSLWVGVPQRQCILEAAVELGLGVSKGEADWDSNLSLLHP